MAYQLHIYIFCASLVLVSVLARPQQVWNIGFNPNFERNPTQATTPTTVATVVDEDPNITTSAAPPVQVTTPSQKYYDCLSRCPTTSEYNPICGSDSVNYHNMARLDCAARCGTAVTMVRAGTCSG